MNKSILLLFFITTLFSINKLSAQWRLVMGVAITDEDGRLNGAEVKLYRNGSLVESFSANSKGIADVPLNPGGDYIIEIAGTNGLVKKKLSINTKNVPPEAYKGDVYFPVDVNVFKKLEGLDYSILDQPMGKIFYNPDDGDFDVDQAYTMRQKEALEKLQDDYERQKNKELANNKEKKKGYDAAVKIADKAFSDGRWEEAELNYKKAAELLPEELHPQFQLAELKTKLIKIRETNAKYKLAIEKADAAASSGDLEVAIAQYKKASGLKPDESYPKEKAEQYQGQLANQAKVEQDYLAAIERGDNALKVNSLEDAKKSFEEASTLKPSEGYPKGKLAEINDILGKQNAKEEEYNAAIKAADAALTAKDYEKAKSSYQKATGVKPLESYPKEQLIKVDGLLAAAAKLEQNYLAAIEKGDNALEAKKYKEAKVGFKEASTLKPTEEYPKNKILEIEKFIADGAVKEEQYKNKIKEADQALASKEYKKAAGVYSQALVLKPNEAYPTEKIKEIETVLLANAKKEEDYNNAIKKGDAALASNRIDEAKSAYNEALGLKPNEKYPQDKLGEIETIALKNKVLDEKYNTAIQNGDDAISNKDFTKAKEFFLVALSIKENEQYPNEKLLDIDKALTEIAENETKYTAAIGKGDAAFNSGSWNDAKTAYNEAISIKQDDYPKGKLKEIEAKLKELAEAEAANEKLEADYQAAIKNGDAALAANDLQKAKSLFENAIQLKADEDYPKNKVTEIEKTIAENAKNEEKYKEAVANADKSFSEGSWEDAKSSYKEAIALKENDYPKNKISEIDIKLKELAAAEEVMAKIEADYQAAISEGDKFAKDEKYNEAIASFTKGLALKSEEKYPSEKIDEIKVILAEIAKNKAEEERLAALQKQYEDLITKADGELASKNLESARKIYQEALALKTEEKYPQTKIDEINTQLNDAAKQDEAYKEIIASADQLLGEESLEEAKKKYSEAASIKASEQYPKDQIKVIETKLAELAAEEEQIRLKEAAASLAESEKAKIEEQYKELINSADKLFGSNEFDKSKAEYEKALAVKNDQYPKDKIKEIDDRLAQLANKEAADALAAEQAKVKAEYLAIIAVADAFLEENQLEKGKAEYEKALSVKEDQYPKDKIKEIGDKLALQANNEAAEKAASEQAKIEAKYLAIIAEADAFFEENQLENSKEKYQEALSIKEDSYPTQQIEKIDNSLSSLANKEAEKTRLAKLEQEYLSAIDSGDEELASNQLNEALISFKKASLLKPTEVYPTEKITDINELLLSKKNEVAANQAKKEADYLAVISQADVDFEAGNYQNSKENYEKALSIKSNEEYPANKVKEIDQILASRLAKEGEIKLQQEREAKNQLAYQSAIVTADRFFGEKKWNEAENEYGLALSLKPSENYPQEQLAKIDELKAQEASALASAKMKKEANKQREAQFKALMEAAEKDLEKSAYNMAKRDYQAALQLKPNDSYATGQLAKVEAILASMQKKKVVEKKEITDEPIQIKSGPKAEINGNAEDDIERLYKEMWAKKNSEKNELLKEKEELVRKYNLEAEEEEAKSRQNEMQRIEDISISMREQYKSSSELNLQNYETVKQKTEDVNTAEMELVRTAERDRNNVYADRADFETNQMKYFSEKEISMLEGKKEMVENEFEEVLETEKRFEKQQATHRESARDEFVKRSEEINVYHNDLSEGRVNGGTEFLDKEIKDNDEFYKEHTKESEERIGQAQQKVSQKEMQVRQMGIEKSESFKGNQEEIEKKVEALNNESISLEKEAEQRRQENKDKEYYQGEDLPRQDPKASEYSQGVTEEVIENNDNSTTIRRIVVEGTEVDIYEKTFFAYGAVFYTKNGNNITEETWDAESR